MTTLWRARVTLGLAEALVVAVCQPCWAEEAPTTRPATFAEAGWYPASANELRDAVDRLLDKASPPAVEHKPIAVIAPHAGYRFSAANAAAAYKCLRGHKYKRAIVIAFSHRWAGAYDGVDVGRHRSAYRTPLGTVPVDREVVNKLFEGGPVFVTHPDVDRSEHSLELQLPFLQRAVGEFSLVPLLVGRMTSETYAEAARQILPWIDDQTVIVVSSDFTHFGPDYGYQPFKDNVPDELRKLADQAAAPLQACDFDGFVNHLAQTKDTICGRGPIQLLLRILSMRGGATGIRTAVDMSGSMVGDWTNSVTYQSFVFVPRRGTLGEGARQELLRLARQTVAAYLRKEKPPEVAADAVPADARADGACFVTLENNGQLRGCIGNMQAQGPLYQAVIRNAVLACQDSRFVQNPVTAGELDRLHIEISYLTPMKPVKNTDEIIVGRHGLYIILGNHGGTLLPQVAYEYGWTREEFLRQVCRKAGLPLDSWKRPEATIYSYEAEVFGEPE